MRREITRRELLRSAAAGGLLVAGTLAPVSPVLGDGPGSGPGRGPVERNSRRSWAPAALEGGKAVEPRRELPLLRRTGVLVVGGGPAGAAAALSARRMGVDVTLVERYGYLGGLATGGLVLAIFPLYDRKNRQVIRGIGEEMMQRLDGIRYGVIERRAAPVYPTVDAEAYKFVLAEMVLASGVRAYLNCWGVDAVIDGKGAVRGAVFESKSGRQAIVADIVVDATGDGDIYAAAGAGFQKVRDNIGLVSRMGNVSIEDMLDEQSLMTSGNRARSKGLRPTRGMPVASLEGQVGSPTPAPGVNWLNMKGPVGDGLDVAEVSLLELRHRVAVWKNLERARRRKGAENAYMVETAPQMGVRLTRLLRGRKILTAGEVRSGARFADAIGCCGAYADVPEFQVPYGCLVPAGLENLLAAGRCVSADFETADILRLIPACWVTGQAAGVAAALCVKEACRPRGVAVGRLQEALRSQGVFLG